MSTTKNAVAFDLTPDDESVTFPVKIGDKIWPLPSFGSLTSDKIDELNQADSAKKVIAFYNSLLDGFGDAIQHQARGASLEAFGQAWRTASDPEGKSPAS